MSYENMAKNRLMKHLKLVAWLLFAALITEWKRWSQADADTYAPDLDRFKALLPLALLGLLYLRYATGPGLLSSVSEAGKQVPQWLWIALFVTAALIPKLFD